MRSALLIAGLLVAIPAAAPGAPEDRGPRGFYIGGGPALLLGTGRDDAGADTPTYTGASYRLRLGEEAIPTLLLGLEIWSAGGASDDVETTIGGLLLQVGWRPLGVDDPLVVLGSTGFGGGALSAPDDSEIADGSVGGALHALGLAYELRLWGGPYRRGVIAPTVNWYFVPSAFGTDVRFSSFHIGADLVWYAGR